MMAVYALAVVVGYGAKGALSRRVWPTLLPLPSYHRTRFAPVPTSRSPAVACRERGGWVPPRLDERRPAPHRGGGAARLPRRRLLHHHRPGEPPPPNPPATQGPTPPEPTLILLCIHTSTHNPHGPPFPPPFSPAAAAPHHPPPLLRCHRRRRRRDGGSALAVRHGAHARPRDLPRSPAISRARRHTSAAYPPSPSGGHAGLRLPRRQRHPLLRRLPKPSRLAHRRADPLRLARLLLRPQARSQSPP